MRWEDSMRIGNGSGEGEGPSVGMLVTCPKGVWSAIECQNHNTVDFFFRSSESRYIACNWFHGRIYLMIRTVSTTNEPYTWLPKSRKKIIFHFDAKILYVYERRSSSIILLPYPLKRRHEQKLPPGAGLPVPIDSATISITKPREKPSNMLRLG